MDVDGNDGVGAKIQGLLLSNGGTVCDDLFTDTSPEAICREMGYLGQVSWQSGSIKWPIQEEYDIVLELVDCSSAEWSSCTYHFDHDCGHSEDVFLQCDGVGELIM